MIAKVPLNELKRSLGAPVDYIVCSCSYEQRSMSIIEALGSDFVARKAFAFWIEDVEPHLAASRERFSEIMGDRCEFIQIGFKRYLKAAELIDSLVDEMGKQCAAPRVLVDTTTFTHETLLMLLKAFIFKASEWEIIMCYTNAESYDSTSDSDEDKWLSIGIRGMHSVLGYPGEIMPSRNTRAVIIVGYEFERAVDVIELLEPSAVSLAYGKPSNATTVKGRSANEHFCRITKMLMPSSYRPETFTVSCDDPVEAKEAILAHVREHIDSENVMVFPMNNKISTIGAGLAAVEEPRIQLCYAPAVAYNYEGYSTPGQHCYVMPLDAILVDSVDAGSPPVQL